MIITITNHGPLITSSNYWDSELALAGKLYVSINAGAIRVLLPRQMYGDLTDMRTAKECVLSRGPWPARRIPEAIEILWDDGSASPYTLWITPDSMDLLPAEPGPGEAWIVSVWTNKDGKPHKAMERPCHWRRVAALPCVQPWRTDA